jgi:hypothetical protein
VRNINEKPLREPPPPVNPEPLRVLVREVLTPGSEPLLGETTFDDPRSIAAARKSRAGGYLRLPLAAVQALGKSAVLLEKFVQGTDLILRVRFVPLPAYVRVR